MILVELGPAYIKVAQAISSRSDLIPPSYLDELSLLQDRITPFSTEVAFDTIEQELGLAIDELFTDISPEPVAAASLGQVYQARLRTNGKVVAVKVQRPGVRAAISLDIFILRSVAGFLRRAGKLNTDLQAVVDEWASSLFRVCVFFTCLAMVSCHIVFSARLDREAEIVEAFPNSSFFELRR